MGRSVGPRRDGVEMEMETLVVKGPRELDVPVKLPLVLVPE